VERYFSEIARVLKVGGRSLISYFLLTAETRSRIAQGASTLPFTYNGSGFKAVSAIVPESAIAYDESYIRGLYTQHGLTISAPIRYGTWSHAASDFEYQDFIIAEKTPF
jgi:hypothetical protein